MSYQIKGKLYKIYPTEKKTETFQTREMVLQTDENYPQMIRFQLVQDNCNQLDNCSEGELVNVSFDLRGREWNGKFITNVQAWRIEKISGETQESASAAGSPMEAMGADLDEAIDDDLPF
jgi:single-strand DNA-binding protein